jgi:hypothetical protein
MAAKAVAQHGLVDALDCRLREYDKTAGGNSARNRSLRLIRRQCDALESVLALRAGGVPRLYIAFYRNGACEDGMRAFATATRQGTTKKTAAAFGCEGAKQYSCQGIEKTGLREMA